MPQASRETVEAVEKILGRDVDDYTASRYLKRQGYTLERDWTWTHPIVKNLGMMTRDEFDVLLYLIHEWDYGSLNCS